MAGGLLRSLGAQLPCALQSRLRLRPGYRFDPREAFFVADPYPVYAWLRSQPGPLRSAQGAWVLSRAVDIEAAYGSAAFLNAPSPQAAVHARHRQRSLCAEVANNILPYLDGPEHAAKRMLVASSFHTQLSQSPLDLKALAEGQLQGFLDQGGGSLPRDFARPLAARLMCRILGLDESLAAELYRWSNLFFYLLSVMPSEDIRQQVEQGLAEWRAYLRPLLDQRQSSPQDDWISRVLQADGSRQTLSPAEIMDNCMLLYADGVMNLEYLIGSSVMLLLTHPQQLALLQAQPERVPAAVEECLRYESPVQFVAKTLGDDYSLQGTRMARGSVVLLLLGSAGRDPERVAAPDRFDLERAPESSLTFGRGRHHCVGTRLAKQQLQAVLRVLLPHLGRLQLSGTPRWQSRLAHRWLEDLQLQIR